MQLQISITQQLSFVLGTPSQQHDFMNQPSLQQQSASQKQPVDEFYNCGIIKCTCCGFGIIKSCWITWWTALIELIGE